MRIPLCCCLLFLLGCAKDPGIPLGARAPNIVLIVADDLGWADLGSYGNDFIETPNLDRLAAQGIRFTDGYAAAPICSPSRATLLTGLHPVTVNITEHIHGNPPPRPGQRLRTPPVSQQLDLNYRTTAEMLTPKGYASAYIGKWHLGGGQYLPENQGFGYTIGAGANGLPQSFFYPFFGPNQHQRLKQAAAEGDYLTDVLTDLAIAYIEARRDSAFFLNLNFYAPHVPIEAKYSLVEKYRQKRAANTTDTLPDPVYAAMVETIDQNVGRLLEQLDRSGIAENTLVIFTSDNGGLSVREVPAFAAHTPPTDNGVLRGGKGYLYEGGTRVPLIVRWPGRVAAEQEIDEPVYAADIFDLLSDLSASSPLLGDPTSGERTAVWHFPHYSPQGGRPASSIRRGRWKLIYDYESETAELYDLVDDPGEQRNRADAEPELTKELQQLLQSELADLGAQLPTPI